MTKKTWTRPEGSPGALRARSWFASVVLTTAGLLALTLLAALRFGQRPSFEVVPLMVSAAAAFTLPVALAPRRARRWVAALCLTATAVVALSDLLHFRYFASILPLQAVAAWSQAWDLRRDSQALLEGADLWLLVPVVLAWGLAVLYPVRRATPRRRWLGAAVLLACFAAAGPAFFHAYAESGALLDRNAERAQNQLRWGYLQAHLGQLAYRWTHGEEELTDQERQAVVAFVDRQGRARDRRDELFGIAPGANLILVQIEALPQWTMDLRVRDPSSGEDLEVTPVLNDLRAESLTYTRIFDQSRHGRTSDAEYLALCSQHPLFEGAVSMLYANNRFVAMPALLQERGYHTVSAHAFRRGFWNRGWLHPRYGFERSLFARELARDDDSRADYIGWGLADSIFLERMADELVGLPEPFLAFLITLSMHSPYQEPLPEAFRSLPLPEQLEGTALSHFLDATHHTDAALGHFLERLRAEGVLDRSILVVYGDHPPSRLRPAALNRALDRESDVPHGRAEKHQIPLLIRFPEGQAAAPVKTIGGLVDLAPTLLHFLGIRSPRGFVGQPLLPSPEGQVEGRLATWDPGLAAGGSLILAEGVCFDAVSWHQAERARCRGLRGGAHEELEASNLITIHDLAAELAEGPP